MFILHLFLELESNNIRESCPKEVDRFVSIETLFAQINFG